MLSKNSKVRLKFEDLRISPENSNSLEMMGGLDSLMILESSEPASVLGLINEATSRLRLNLFETKRFRSLDAGAIIVQAVAVEELAEGHGDVGALRAYADIKRSNKGIGFEICRQLAAKGIIVVLTARDEKKGFEALEKLKSDGLSDHVVFCQLDVVDPSSVASLADFIKSKFGSLDILVNNAGIVGFKMDWDSLQSSEGSWEESWKKVMTQSYELGNECLQTNYYGTKRMIEALIPLLQLSNSPRIVNVSAAAGKLEEEKLSSWKKVTTETYELGNECLQTNYYGTKRMVEALIPLLQLSDSPRIVNVSSVKGKLELISSEWAKGVLNDVESLTKERVEEVLNEFLKDFKEGAFETKGWPTSPSAYTVSKAAVNAYTRFLAKKYPTFRINCVCPGWVKTDINNHTGDLTTEQGAQCPVKLALLPDDGPSGLFFTHNEPSSFV
ncbi:hypothetical protein TEA_002315 [Camellia sinensis var. sinensis]|uniref:(+)-neomenthol dehydrogenase n=1 Tax=Camellia sinensis var. sinensis TaxID=542762 RepID=A0A4S4DRJ7_CAMSN|nr:hypothetical protein TEA_002315 [Camellia sinensis var. sinensis]